MTDSCIFKNSLFFDDFSSGLVPKTQESKSPYIIAYGGTDGTATASKYNFNIKSVFTKWSSDGLDHIKYFALSNNYYVAPRDGKELAMETVITGNQILPSTLPFPYAEPGSAAGVSDAQSDPRICAASFNTIDEETFTVANFFVTNNQVYALYERLPFGRGVGGLPEDYMAFTHLVPVATRKPEDNLKITICYNYRANYIRWLVNDQEVLRVNRIGYPIGKEFRVIEHAGTPYLARPRGFKVGFGAFSLLDAYNPVNIQRWQNAGLVKLEGPDNVDPMYTDINGDPLPLQYLSESSREVQVFGQGVDMTLRYLSVYTQNEDRSPISSGKCMRLINKVPTKEFDKWEGAVTKRPVRAYRKY